MIELTEPHFDQVSLKTIEVDNVSPDRLSIKATILFRASSKEQTVTQTLFVLFAKGEWDDNCRTWENLEKYILTEAGIPTGFSAPKDLEPEQASIEQLTGLGG